MKVGENRESFTVVADSQLHQALLAARKAGRRYGGKLVSGTMAYELGVRVLLDLEENEENVIIQDIEDLSIQQAAIEQKKRLRKEQLQIMQASRAAKIEDATLQNDNVQKLAQKIIDVWDKIVIYKKYNLINGLIDIDKTRLNRPKLEAIFPKKITHKPSIDDAIKIAWDLLEGETVDA